MQAGPIDSDGSRNALDGFAAGHPDVRLAQGACRTAGAGDSGFIWQTSAMLGYNFATGGLGPGSRILDHELEDGSDELDLAYEGRMHGVESRFRATFQSRPILSA